MKVMHLKWILYSAIAPFICRTVEHPGPHASACHPNTESILIVITFIAALCKWSAAKFSCPYHKWSVEQAALLQVLKQPGDRLINCKSIIAVMPDDPVMSVPPRIAGNECAVPRATRHSHTSHYSPTSRIAGALENRVVPVKARSTKPQCNLLDHETAPLRPRALWVHGSENSDNCRDDRFRLTARTADPRPPVRGSHRMSRSVDVNAVHAGRHELHLANSQSKRPHQRVVESRTTWTCDDNGAGAKPLIRPSGHLLP